MNQSAKSLRPEQVKEIFVAFRSMEEMAHQLGRDLERGSGELAANRNDQFLRRNLVRIFAALVEGYSFVFKQFVLQMHEPLQMQLSVDELSKLKEVRLDDAGEPVLERGIPKRRFLGFHDNFKFASALFGRLCGCTYSVSFGSRGHETFQATITVRDRLMHPKAIQDLNVTDTEIMDLQTAWRWHQAEMVALMKGSIEPLNERFRPLLRQGTHSTSGGAG